MRVRTGLCGFTMAMEDYARHFPVVEVQPAQPVYWRLHGPAGPRSSYSDAQLQQLREMLERARNPAPRYVMFNNIPRVGDATRFVRVAADKSHSRVASESL